VPKDLVVHKRNISRLLERVSLDDVNCEILMKYYNQMLSEGLSELRIVKCLNHLLVSSRLFNKPFEDAPKGELMDMLARIRLERKVNERTYEDYKMILKKFLKSIGVDSSWIKAKSVEKDVLPEELLTKDEVTKMANSATNSRDRAFSPYPWSKFTFKIDKSVFGIFFDN